MLYPSRQTKSFRLAPRRGHPQVKTSNGSWMLRHREEVAGALFRLSEEPRKDANCLLGYALGHILQQSVGGMPGTRFPSLELIGLCYALSFLGWWFITLELQRHDEAHDSR